MTHTEIPVEGLLIYIEQMIQYDCVMSVEQIIHSVPFVVARHFGEIWVLGTKCSKPTFGTMY